ncbi:MAG: hypothetical protein LUE86_01485 [Clostridiales bacterium]|nr:hypothetical protein [Clostridiales bacterium]
MSGGISRLVRVYDMEGDLIEEYAGTFDVETDEHYVLFDDEKGKRHMIYYTTGTIIIDEVEEEELPVAISEGDQH